MSLTYPMEELIVCFDMSKKFENQGKLDSLYISIVSKDFSQFITYENY